MFRALLVFSGCLTMGYAQLYDSFDIPTFEFKNASVSGSPLLSAKSTGGENITQIATGGMYTFSLQSPEFTYSYGANLDYGRQSRSWTETLIDWEGENRTKDTTNTTGEFGLNVPFSVNKYFGDSKGVYAFADGNLDFLGGPDWEGVDDTKDLNLTVGI